MDNCSIVSSTSVKSEQEEIEVCECIFQQASTEKIEISNYKQRILSTVSRTENYLRERRIPELIRFLLCKVLAQQSNKPILYLEKLLDDCMLFRAGMGKAPVLFEDKHLEAIIKSFDPGQRGWLTVGQVRRLYSTLGLTPDVEPLKNITCDILFKDITRIQENELFKLISASSVKEII